MCLMMLVLPGCVLFQPVKESDIVFVHEGAPGRVAESIVVKIAVQKDGETFTDTQNIGGWPVMPPTTYDALMRRIKFLLEENKKLRGR